MSAKNQARIVCLLSLMVALLAQGFTPAAGSPAVDLPPTGGMADIGPKPGMDFTFQDETGLGLSIVSGDLLECDDADCQDAEVLEEVGPQRLACDPDHCYAVAYSFTDYHRLRLHFSDGKTRQSNIFSKHSFDANFQVTIREDDLLVDEIVGSSQVFSPLNWISVALGSAVFCGLDIVFLPILIVLVAWIVRSESRKAGFSQAKGLYIAAWLVGGLLLITGSFFTLALPLTAAIESLLAWVYGALRKLPRVPLLTVLLLANLITAPGLWFLLQGISTGPSILVMAVAELAIWLIEAGILFLTQNRKLSVLEALGLSLLLNASSFGLGLLIPI